MLRCNLSAFTRSEQDFNVRGSVACRTGRARFTHPTNPTEQGFISPNSYKFGLPPLNPGLAGGAGGRGRTRPSHRGSPGAMRAGQGPPGPVGARPCGTHRGRLGGAAPPGPAGRARRGCGSPAAGRPAPASWRRARAERGRSPPHASGRTTAGDSHRRHRRRRRAPSRPSPPSPPPLPPQPGRTCGGARGRR